MAAIERIGEAGHRTPPAKPLMEPNPLNTCIRMIRYASQVPKKVAALATARLREHLYRIRNLVPCGLFHQYSDLQDGLLHHFSRFAITSSASRRTSSLDDNPESENRVQIKNLGRIKFGFFNRVREQGRH
jgi:hypothetical protein